MDWHELALWAAAATIAVSPILTWDYGLVGLKIGFVGLGLLGVATLWSLANDAARGLIMFMAWLGAFSYVGGFALIAHAAGHLHPSGRAH